MLRMILWKEWREQRMIVLTAVGWSALTPLLIMMMDALAGGSRGVTLREISSVLPVLLLCFLWPCFLLAVGANTIANETGEGTLGFLLSRPISRARLWSAKVLMAAAAGGIVLIGILAVCWVVALLAGQPSMALAQLADDQPFAGFILPGIVVGLGVAVVCFTMAILCSTVMSRTLTAAAAALVATLTLCLTQAFVWLRLDLVPRLEPQWPALQLLLSAAVILAGSYWMFARGEMLLSRAHKAVTCAAIALVGLPAAMLPPVLALTRLTPSAAVLGEVALPDSGSDVLVTAARSDGGSSQIWSIAADGSGMTRLTGRLAMHPAVSPDGRLVAYLSGRGMLGLRADSATLRLARTDGTGDWKIADGLTLMVSTKLIWSADGARVAAQQGTRLVVAPIAGAEALTCALDSHDRSRAWLVGFAPDGLQPLVLRTGPRDDDAARLLAVAPGSCTERLVQDFGEPADPASLFHPVRPGRYFSFVTQKGEPGSRKRALHLVDLTSGAHRLMTASACHAPAGLSRDAKTLAYAECVTDGTSGQSVIHMVGLDDGADRAVATIPGRAWAVYISPSGDRAAVRLQAGESLHDVVIEPDGQVRDLDAGWWVLGWNGENRLVLAESETDGGMRRRLALASAGSWEPRQFYPERPAGQ